MQHKIIQIDEIPPLGKGVLLSFQHLFAMFGATVLVPTIFGINPSIVLMMNGLGTIIYLFICKGKIPAFLGSSFSFIPPVLLILGTNKLLWPEHFPLALGGFIAVGIVLMVAGILVRLTGVDWLKNILSPATIGPITALIGLELASTAAKMAGFLPDADGTFNDKYLIISITTLAVAVFGSVLFRGFFSIISILIGLTTGYLLSMYLGIVDFTHILTTQTFTLPHFVSPQFNANAIITIVPVTLVVIAEHISHLMVTGTIVGKDLVKKPGLHLSLFGNGISTFISGMMGSVPTTSYGENIGVLAITRVYSVWIIGGAGLLSLLLAFIGKFAALIQSIPTPVIGGISLYLFGVITTSGIRMIVDSQVDYNRNTNLILSAVIFSVGICGAAVKIGSIYLKGMALGAVVGILLNIILYVLERANLLNTKKSDEIPPGDYHRSWEP